MDVEIVADGNGEVEVSSHMTYAATPGETRTVFYENGDLPSGTAKVVQELSMEIRERTLKLRDALLNVSGEPTH